MAYNWSSTGFIQGVTVTVIQDQAHYENISTFLTEQIGCFYKIEWAVIRLNLFSGFAGPAVHHLLTKF